MQENQTNIKVIEKKFEIETDEQCSKVANRLMVNKLFPNNRKRRFKNNYLFKKLCNQYKVAKIFIKVPPVKPFQKKIIIISCVGDDIYKMNFFMIDICHDLIYKSNFIRNAKIL